VKNKRLVVAATFALLLVSGVPAAWADGPDMPWDGPKNAVADFTACVIEAGLTALEIAL
jgi:hypothetical protein